MKKNRRLFRIDAGIVLLALAFSAACSSSAPASPSITTTVERSTPSAKPSATQKPTRTTAEVTSPTPEPSPTPESPFAPYLAPALPDGALARMGKGLIYDMALSPDGESVALATSIGVYRYRLDPQSGAPQEMWFTATAMPMTSAAFSPDGTTLAAGSHNDFEFGWGTAFLWEPYAKKPAVLLLDASSGQPLKIFSLGSEDNDYRICRLAFSPDGTVMAAGFFEDGGESGYLRAGIGLWNLTDGTSFEVNFSDAGLGEYTSAVAGLAFSPDGALLASGAKKVDSVQIWDVREGSLRHSLEGHADAVGSVAFSPDGKTLASGTDDGTVILWNTDGWEKIRTLSGSGKAMEKNSYGVNPQSHTSDLEFSADGRILAAAAGDGAVVLWNAAAGTRILSLSGHTGPAGDLSFSADGKNLLSASFDGKILRHDSRSGTLKQSNELTGHERVSAPVFSPDGGYLLGLGSGSAAVWETAGGSPLFSITGSPVVVSPDWKFLAAGTANHSIELWDAAAGRKISTLAGHTGDLTAMEFSPDGTILATGAADTTVILWDVAARRIQFILRGHSEPIDKVAFSPDGKTLASGGLDSSIVFWDSATGQKRAGYAALKGDLRLGAFPPDGKILACIDRSDYPDTKLLLLDPATGTVIDSISVNPPTWSDMVFTPDGSTVVTFDWYFGTQFIELDGESEFHHPDDGITGPGVSFSADGKLGAGSDIWSIVVWDTTTGKWVHQFMGHTGGIRETAFSPDGKMLASASLDGTILLWDLAAALGR